MPFSLRERDIKKSSQEIKTRCSLYHLCLSSIYQIKQNANSQIEPKPTLFIFVTMNQFGINFNFFWLFVCFPSAFYLSSSSILICLYAHFFFFQNLNQAYTFGKHLKKKENNISLCKKKI